MVAAGQVVLDPLVTAAYPLARWEEALARTAAADGLKILIDPRLPADAGPRT
jgi:hypothetical protein